MYIRLQDSSIRYRLSMDEALQLLDGEALSESTPLLEDVALHYSVAATEKANQFDFHPAANQLRCQINRLALRQEIDGRPSKQGIQFSQSIGNRTLTIAVEVNLKKS